MHHNRVWLLNPNNKSMEVREGVPVIFRQKLLSIPNLDSMQVETRIHESASTACIQAKRSE